MTKTAPATESNFLISIAAARQEAQTLFELSQDLGASLSLGETLSVFSMKLRRSVPYDGIAVYVLRQEELVPEYVNGDNFRLFGSLRIPFGQGLSGWVAQHRKPIINGNPSVEPGYLNDATKFSTLESALVVPLEGLKGVIGVMALYHQERNAFHQRSPANTPGHQFKDGIGHRQCFEVSAGRKLGNHRFSNWPAECSVALPITRPRTCAM